MKLRKGRVAKQNKRCGTLSQLCVLLLFLLVVFYVTVASYLIKPSSKYKHSPIFDGDDDHRNNALTVLDSAPAAPVAPKIDSYKIPQVPTHKIEDKQYAPPHFDAIQAAEYVKSNKHMHSPPEIDIEIDIPSQRSPENDYSDLEGIEAQYRDKCPDKFPKKVPSINELPFICSNLNDFDVRYAGTCSLETCDECVPPTSRRMQTENTQTRSMQTQFKEQMEPRRNNLSALISHLRPKADGPIILMVFNHGYAWLFYNLLCSLEYNAIDIANRSIIVTTDRESYDLVTATGFKAHYPDWLGERIMKGITKKAAASFALGAHKWIVSIQIALITDLIHMGYDVIMQDIDMIWYKSPIPYLMQPIYQNIDIQMSVDGTMGLRGPGNSGFFIIRSNCKTKRFMDTMISLIGLVMTGRSDQILWNTLLQEKPFRMINFETLTTQHFISGFQVNIAHKTQRKDLPQNHFIVHASWTTDQWDKIEKFYNIQHWYFTQEKCPKWYQFEYLPDLKERKWHIRDKTQEQEIKFKELGLFRDSTKGVYAKHS